MSWVRRHFLHILSVIACQCVSIPLVAETTPDISVHVEMRGEVIRVDVDLIIAAPPKEVWEVLTDFERLPRFISNITSSKSFPGSGILSGSLNPGKQILAR